MVSNLSKHCVVLALLTFSLPLSLSNTKESETLVREVFNADVYPKEGTPDGKVLVQKGKRYAIEFLVERWENGEKKPLNDFLKAFKLIQELPSVDERSFQHIASIHGRPFLTREGKKSFDYWGGFCQHGNILFPVWHRAYLFYVERSLQSVLNNPDVRMPYWDEIGQDTIEKGLPEIFTVDLVWIDSQPTKNPLKNFTFPMKYLEDQPTVEDSVKYFNINHTTVRFPLFHFGDGTVEQQIATFELNKRYPGNTATEALNENVREWINGDPEEEDKKKKNYNIKQKYEACLTIDEYTYFSNVVSAGYHKRDTNKTIWSLEHPHNDVHLALGAARPWYMSEQWAYGDMGFFGYAAYDPIFFLHHSYIDLVFWKWQLLHNSTQQLEIIEGHHGTFSSGHHQLGPTPGFKENEPVSMDTYLYPFRNLETFAYLTGNDVTNIMNLDYDYVERTELKAIPPRTPKPAFTELARDKISETGQMRNLIRVWNVDRIIQTSPFMVVVSIKTPEGQFFVGQDTVLDGLLSDTCEECEANRFMEFFFSLEMVHPTVVYSEEAEIVVRFIAKLLPGSELHYKAEFVQ